MAREKDQKSAILEGLEPVDPKELEEFQREMKDKVIPEILEVVEKRRALAARSRQKQLKL